ncbi:hypothetical protein Lal_00033425 [Lupinus albus]|nr:hypothetical protein Lal_00033425 [Lupinus albus]
MHEFFRILAFIVYLLFEFDDIVSIIKTLAIGWERSPSKPITRRTYKHRTNRQPDPTDELEPTAEPNQPESHAQSSSSNAIPTNQMIMDELVSLRVYITTRMDAFDTQSQQIHYELHRLSSRLSNMDVDEDSSEPES